MESCIRLRETARQLLTAARQLAPFARCLEKMSALIDPKFVFSRLCLASYFLLTVVAVYMVIIGLTISSPLTRRVCGGAVTRLLIGVSNRHKLTVLQL